MSGHLVSYPALEQAIRDGAMLRFGYDVKKARCVTIWSQDKEVAMGFGVTLTDALHAAEQDLLSDDPLGAQISGCGCQTCALNRLAPKIEGRAEPESVLEHHGFKIRFANEQFILSSKWWRRADRHLKETLRQIAETGETSRWQHGEYIWECIPSFGRKTGKLMMIMRPVNRPNKKVPYCPEEERQVEIRADSLGAVMAAAEQPLAQALSEDAEWCAQTRRCT